MIRSRWAGRGHEYELGMFKESAKRTVIMMYVDIRLLIRVKQGIRAVDDMPSVYHGIGESVTKIMSGKQNGAYAQAWSWVPVEGRAVISLYGGQCSEGMANRRTL